MASLRDALTIPAGSATSIRSEQGEYIVELLSGLPITRTLETGFAYGVSAAYILSATRAPHIAVDPYEESYGNLGLANVARLGFQDPLEFVRLPSHVALPQLLARGVCVDFAFVDSHRDRIAGRDLRRVDDGMSFRERDGVPAPEDRER